MNALKSTKLCQLIVIFVSGRPLKVVNGEHRGCHAEMIGLNEGKFTASVKLTSVSYRYHLRII